MVINKIDSAAAETLTMLRTIYPGAVFVSARTGEGIDQLRAAIESQLPRPEVEIRALIPYERGDLVNRIHQTGEFLSSEHRAAGTLVAARVNPSLAADLAPYELASSDSARRAR
jgi:GTP-binding protein HflX